MKIYMTKEYAYRRRHVLFGGIVATLFGVVPLFCFVVPDFIRSPRIQFTLPSLFGCVFVVGIPSMLLFAGLWLLHAWLTRRVNKLKISDEGIQYGTRMRSWEQIRRLSWRYFQRGTPTLFYHKKGFSLDYNLMLTDPLTEDEVNSLFGVLEREIVPLHHELQIG